MARNFRKTLSLVLALLMCMSLFSIPAMAEENTAGMFKSVYPPAYEMSGHMVSTDGGVSNDIPQTLVMVKAEDYISETEYPSEFEAMYCCDAETGYAGGVDYRRLNLEDSGYYDDSDAAHIRAIVSNSYPYISMSSMKSRLAEGGFADADKLTKSEIISAVQAAIWHYANGADYLYSKTFDVASNSQWGSPDHSIVEEGERWWVTGKRKYSTSEEVEARINGLRDYLLGLGEKEADKDQIVISELEILEHVPVQGSNGAYSVALRVKLNGSVDSEDSIVLTVSVDGETVAEIEDIDGKTYDLFIEAKNGSTISAEINGIQILDTGVYFYEPVEGYKVSQCLVGKADGETAIHAKKDVTLDVVEVFGKLVLQKTDTYGKALSGAKFDLYVKADSGDFKVGSYEVDGDGQLVIENLLPGEYYVKETKAPFAHFKAEGEIEFEIDAEGNLVGEAVQEGVLVVENEPYEFEFPSGGASNISYMLIDEYGNIEFVKKIDLSEGDTTAPIIMKSGYVSAMFIKQSTSGLFWFSEDVDDEVVEAVIECLKENNPSYSGHDEDIAFGPGEHDLTYEKKNGKSHTVTYNFNCVETYVDVDMPEQEEEAAEEEAETESEDESETGDEVVEEEPETETETETEPEDEAAEDEPETETETETEPEDEVVEEEPETETETETEPEDEVVEEEPETESEDEDEVVEEEESSEKENNGKGNGKDKNKDKKDKKDK